MLNDSVEVGQVTPDQAVHVVGDGDVLGGWEASKALRLSKKSMPGKAGPVSVWELAVELVTGVSVNYKYVIIGTRDRRVKWESSKAEFRTVTPAGFEMVVVDGAFGRELDEVWVDEGWLNSEYQVRIELGYFDVFDGSYTPPITGALTDIDLDSDLEHSLGSRSENRDFKNDAYLPSVSSTSSLPNVSSFSSNPSSSSSSSNNSGPSGTTASTNRAALTSSSDSHLLSQAGSDAGSATSSFVSASYLHNNYLAQKHPPMSLHFFDGNSLLSREVVSLPLKDQWTEVVFHMSDLNKLKITVEVYDRRHVDPQTRFSGESQSSNDAERLGRTCISRSLLKDMRGIASVPIFNSQLEHVGTLNFKYVVVTPFQHSLNNLSSIWKSYTRASKPIGKSVGHRGCGSTRTTVISENTLLSFLTAADYGADYVEFDVQLTNEGVPVINHDFHMTLTSNEGENLQIPVSSLTKKQFKTLRPSSHSLATSIHESPISTAFQRIPGLKRSKSATYLDRKQHRHSRSHTKQSHDSSGASLQTAQSSTASNNDKSSSSSSSQLLAMPTPLASIPASASMDSFDETMSSTSSSTIDSNGYHSSTYNPLDLKPRRLMTPLPADLLSHQSHAEPKSIINPHDHFSTLDETLRLVPAEVGFVIEVKYPAERFQHSSKMRYAERNAYADAVLTSVFNAMRNTQIASRKIMFISFDPDLCVLLSQKQPRFPVLFLVCLGHGIPVGPGDDEVEGFDPRCQSLDMAVKFAKNVRLQGIICDAQAVLVDPQTFVSKAHEASLLLMTYGQENMDSEKRATQKAAGVDSLIMDNVVHINRESRKRKQVSSMFVADYGRQNFKVAPSI